MPLPKIAEYTLSERIGTGGFASVYLATREADDHLVAIKVLHAHTSDEGDLRRFERERQTMLAFSGHPNIVSVFDSGTNEDGMHYTVLEFVSGGSVRDLLADQRALHWSDTLRIGVQVCSALDIAHRSGVLHRDVKPANILLDEDAVKLSDFGIARLVGQSQVTAAQSIIGTLAYTPPEIFHGSSFDGRGDIYQLGISMYEMLLGRPPFSSATSDNKATIIRRILEKPAPGLEQFDVPAPISDLLEQVLAKDPADRPQTAERFGELLNEIEVELGQAPTQMATDQDDLPSNEELGGAPTEPLERPTPTPPVITPPADADLTVIGQARDPGTAIMDRDTLEPDSVEPSQPESIKRSESIKLKESSTPTPELHPDPEPVVAPPIEQSGQKPWIPLILGLLLVCGIGGAIAFTQLGGNDTATDDATGETAGDQDPNEGTDVDSAELSSSEFAPIATDVFALPDTTDGIVFGSVANSQGLTIVGSVGNGEELPDQRSVVWTFGSEGFEMQRDVDENSPHRMWAIGVIEQETFLAVGDAPGLDGAAWTGDRATAFTPVTSTDFTGDQDDYLRASVHDPSLGDTFLVGGTRTSDGIGVPGLWQVTADPSWDNPTWTAIEIGRGAPGVVNDIAVSGDIAVAVGMETVGDQNIALMKVRQDGNWSDLIGPLDNTELWGVTILDGRIIAVGVQNTNSTSPTPIAIIADTAGSVPRRHSLPIRSGDGGVQSGIARSIITLNDGTVLAVGDVDRALEVGNPDSEIDKDGAIWELLPGDTLGNDLWTTRASPDLLVDGFTELWTIDQFDGDVYVFGRTEAEDGTQPAGAWVLNLDN